MIGMFFNQFMLASVGGDAIRIWLATRYGIKTRVAFNSTLFDRLFGVLALLMIIIVCMPVYHHALNKLTILSLTFLVLGIIAAMLILLFFDRLPIVSRLTFFQRTFGVLSGDARRIFLSFKNIRKPTAYALPAVLMPSLMVYLIGHAYHFTIPLSHCLAIIPPVMLISLLPISIAGWGVREGSMVVVASYLGITPSQAILVSVWLGITMLVASLPGAIFWLAHKSTQTLEKEQLAS